MSTYYYKTNGEEVKCVNCGNTDFSKGPAQPQNGSRQGYVPYECDRCHFVAWFPADFAPGAEAPKG